MKRKELDPIIKTVLKKHSIDAEEACWDCKGTTVIYHHYLERLAEAEGIIFDPPDEVFVDAPGKGVVVRVTGRLAGSPSVWSYGEAMPYNNNNAYPFAMAEKRGKDRVILKLIGLSGHVYSEEEADDFKRSRPNLPPPPVMSAVPAGPVSPIVETYDDKEARIQAIYRYLTGQKGGASRKGIIDATAMTLSKFNDAIRDMKEKGIVEMSGNRRSAKWHLASNAVPTVPEVKELPAVVPDTPKTVTPPPPTLAPAADDGNGIDEVDLFVDRMVAQGVNFMDLSERVRRVTGHETAHEAHKAGKLTADAMRAIEQLAC